MSIESTKFILEHFERSVQIRDAFEAFPRLLRAKIERALREHQGEWFGADFSFQKDTLLSEESMWGGPTSWRWRAKDGSTEFAAYFFVAVEGDRSVWTLLGAPDPEEEDDVSVGFMTPGLRSLGTATDRPDAADELLAKLRASSGWEVGTDGDPPSYYRRFSLEPERVLAALRGDGPWQRALDPIVSAWQDLQRTVGDDISALVRASNPP